MKPVVLHVISHLRLGGAENVVLDLIETMAPHCDFKLFAVLDEDRDDPIGQAMRSRLRAAGVNVSYGTKLRFKRGGALEAALRLRRVISEKAPNIVHLHTEIPELTYAISNFGTSRRRDVQIFRTIHNSRLWNGWGWIGRNVVRRLAGANIVAVSEAAMIAERGMRRAAGVRAPSDDAGEIIYNGVKLPKRRDFAPKPKDAFRLLFAGRLELQKGADLLPRIFLEASQRVRSQVDVTIAGQGTLEDKLKKEMKPPPGWSVRTLPGIANLPDRLCEFDTLLMPSRFEGLGLTAIEALLAGTPVIGTDAPGLREVLPPDDPLSSPVDDVPAIADGLADVIMCADDHRNRLEAMRPSLSRKFGRERMAGEYLAAYQRALGRQRSE